MPESHPPQAMTTTPDRPPLALRDCLSSRARALRSQLAATGSQDLADLIRRLRAKRGLSQRRLAELAGVHRSTVYRIETAAIRVRPATLAGIANALDPDRRGEILVQLTEAAGDRLAADSDQWTGYRHRMQQRMLEDGRASLPVAIVYQLRLFAASEAMRGLASTLIDRAIRLPEVPSTAARLGDLADLVDLLHEESRQLVADGGTPIYGASVPSRRRGDPPDADPVPPSAANLHAAREWVRGWQVRQGRVNPRTGRERAIAASGASERASVAAAPAVRTVSAEQIGRTELTSRRTGHRFLRLAAVLRGHGWRTA